MSTKKLRKAKLDKEEKLYKKQNEPANLDVYNDSKTIKQYQNYGSMGLGDSLGQNKDIMRDPYKSGFVKRQAAKRYLDDYDGISTSNLDSFVKGEEELGKLDASRKQISSPAFNRNSRNFVESSVDQYKSSGLPEEQFLYNQELQRGIPSGYNRTQVQLNALAAAADQEIPYQTTDFSNKGLALKAPLQKPKGMPEREVIFDRVGSATEYLASDDAPIPEGLVEVPGSGGRAFVQPEDAKTIKSRREADFYRDTLFNARKTGFAEDVFERIEQTAAARREAKGLGDIPTEGLLSSLTRDANLTGTALTFGGKRANEAAKTILNTLEESGLNVADLNNAEKRTLITIKSGLADPMSNTRREATEQLQGLVSGSMLRRADEAAGRLNEDLAIGDTEREMKQNQLIVQNLTSKFIAGTATPEEIKELGRAMKATAIIRDIDDVEAKKKKITTAATYLTTISTTGQRRIDSIQKQLEEETNDAKRNTLNEQIKLIQDQVTAASKNFMKIYEGTNLEGLTADDLRNNTPALQEALNKIDEEAGLTDTTSDDEVTKPVLYELTDDIKQELDNVYDLTKPTILIASQAPGGQSREDNRTFEQRMSDKFRKEFGSDEAYNAFLKDQKQEMIDRLTKESTPKKGMAQKERHLKAQKRLDFILGK
jgi:hypothetical protein|tara:strand:+ start:3676 stop:5640 length:1965 start_codon:yes stop_codon:yes gene_type:complete